jgi:hypothetical protein
MVVPPVAENVSASTIPQTPIRLTATTASPGKRRAVDGVGFAYTSQRRTRTDR